MANARLGEVDARAAIDQALNAEGQPTVNDAHFQVLTHTDEYKRWVTGDDEVFEEVIDLVVEMHEGSGRKVAADRRVGGSGGKSSAVCDMASSVLSRLVARAAARDPEVVEWRDLYLRGPQPPSDDLCEFMFGAQPPLRLLSFDEIDPWLREQVSEPPPPPVQLSDEMLAFSDKWYEESVFPVIEASIKSNEQLAELGARMNEARTGRRKSRTPRRVLEHADERNGVAKAADRSLLAYQSPDSQVRFVFHRQGSPVLERLNLMGRYLSASYRWSEPQSVTFFLTGIAPTVHRFDVQFEAHANLPALSRVNLSVDPSLSPEEVARIYAGQRRRMRARGLSEKHTQLALYVFDERADEHPQVWPELMAAWNDREVVREREWSYKQAFIFRRDAELARNRILFPGIAEHDAKGAGSE